jgi:hypothetical protein
MNNQHALAKPMTPSVPMAAPTHYGPIQRLNVFLDKYVLPYPVKYLTNRVTILATLCLLVPLIVFAGNQIFVLAANSYLNVMSVVVSSTVLLYSTLAEARDRAAAQRREEIAQQHEARIEARAEADHKNIMKIMNHLDDLHNEVMEHFNDSLDNILNLMISRLEQIQNEDQSHITEAHKAVLASADAHRKELEDLTALVESMRKRINDQPKGNSPEGR